jgi:hypothetical protein
MMLPEMSDHQLVDLLLCQDNPEERVSTLQAFSPEQWKRVQVWAKQLGVRALVYAGLKRSHTTALLPMDVLEDLQQPYLVNLARNVIFLEAAGHHLESLKKAGLHVAGLKGIFLLENIYEDIGERYLGDIDFLMPKPELAAGLAYFQGLGYEMATYFDLADPNVDIKHVPPLSHEGQPIVELHWNLLEADEPFSIAIEPVWQRVVTAQIASKDAYALCREDLIAHLSLHFAFQHSLDMGLRGLVDLDRAIRHYQGEIDWQKLGAIARDWSAQRPVWLGLSLAYEWLHSPVPVSILNDLKPEGAQTVLDLANEILLGEKPVGWVLTPDLARLAGNKHITSKFNLFWKRVFIPKGNLSRLYGVSPRSVLIYWFYVRRLVDIIGAYSKPALHVMRTDRDSSDALKRQDTINELHAWLGRQT